MLERIPGASEDAKRAAPAPSPNKTHVFLSDQSSNDVIFSVPTTST